MNNLCCKDEKNLEIQPDSTGMRIHKKCKVCGRNQYTMKTETISIGMKGNELGK